MVMWLIAVRACSLLHQFTLSSELHNILRSQHDVYGTRRCQVILCKKQIKHIHASIHI